MLVAPGDRSSSQVLSPQTSPFRPHSEHDKATRVLGPSPTRISVHLSKPQCTASEPASTCRNNTTDVILPRLPPKSPPAGRMRRTGARPQPARRRRCVYTGHSLRKACFPRRGEAVLGGDYVVWPHEEKQRKRLSRLWRASVSNSNFRFVSRFRSPSLTSGRRGFLCGRFLHPLLSVQLCSRWGDAGHPCPLPAETPLGWRTAALLSSVRDLHCGLAGRLGLH